MQPTKTHYKQILLLSQWYYTRTANTACTDKISGTNTSSAPRERQIRKRGRGQARKDDSTKGEEGGTESTDLSLLDRSGYICGFAKYVADFQ
jgi:hypothetical protein